MGNLSLCLPHRSLYIGHAGTNRVASHVRITSHIDHLLTPPGPTQSVPSLLDYRIRRNILSILLQSLHPRRSLFTLLLYHLDIPIPPSLCNNLSLLGMAQTLIPCRERFVVVFSDLDRLACCDVGCVDRSMGNVGGEGDVRGSRVETRFSGWFV